MAFTKRIALWRTSFLILMVFAGSIISWGATPALAHVATPASMRGGGDTIILVHGFNDDYNGSSSGFDCSAHSNYGWGNVIDYINSPHDINGQQLQWQRTFDIQTVQFYNGDVNCNADLHSSAYTSHCNHYVTGNEGNNNEDLYHLSCLFAWYIYLNYGIHPGWNVEIVAHSMGGLIVRNAIYQVQQSKATWTMPPTLGGISDVVTFATPHGGVNGASSIFGCHGCTQGSEMGPGSQFMNEMYNSAQNPQAAHGTDWTLMGDDSSVRGLRCDQAGPPGSAMYMIGGHKSVFENQCYSHEGYLDDANDAYDAHIHWCDGCGLPPAYFSSWNYWTGAPHSLHHMMYALWLSNW